MFNFLYCVQECTCYSNSIGVETICASESLDEVKNFMKSYEPEKKPGCGNFYFLQKGIGKDVCVKSFRQGEPVPEI